MHNTITTYHIQKLIDTFSYFMKYHSLLYY